MADFALDFGNSDGKWFSPEHNLSGRFASAIAPLSPHEWNSILENNGGRIPKGFILVNRKPYALAEAAQSYSMVFPQGGDRYTPDYYGVAFAYAYTQFLDKALDAGKIAGIPPTLHVMGLMPPRDFLEHTKTLKSIGKRAYHVKTQEWDFSLQADNFYVRAEPLAGYVNWRYTERLQEKSLKELPAHPSILAVDLGGFTLDLAGITSTGAVDYGRLHSHTIGVMKVLGDLERSLRAHFKGQFSPQALPRERLEYCLQKGEYPMGREHLDASQIVTPLINRLSNEVAQIVRQAGGDGSYDVILLTGGGGALIQPRIEEVFSRAFVYLADSVDNLQKANVFGAAKLLYGEKQYHGKKATRS